MTRVLPFALLLIACESAPPATVSATIHVPITIDKLPEPGDQGWLTVESPPAGDEWPKFRADFQKQCRKGVDFVLLTSISLSVPKGGIPFRDWDWRLLLKKDDGSSTWAASNFFDPADKKIDRHNPIRHVDLQDKTAPTWALLGVALSFHPLSTLTLPVPLSIEIDFTAHCTQGS